MPKKHCYESSSAGKSEEMTFNSVSQLVTTRTSLLLRTRQRRMMTRIDKQVRKYEATSLIFLFPCILVTLAAKRRRLRGSGALVLSATLIRAKVPVTAVLQATSDTRSVAARWKKHAADGRTVKHRLGLICYQSCARSFVLQ